MKVLPALFMLSMAPALIAPARSAQIDLACESGCISADSLQVADAIRVGLARHGVTVMRHTNGRELPLTVTGRITVQGDTVRVAAEFLELEHAIARYTVRARRTDLTVQVLQMGDRFGRAVIEP